MIFNKIDRTFRKLHILPDVLALIGILAYSVRSLFLAHFLCLNMDEGTYLMKGLLFIRGEYIPYQFYGPWSQKMPVSYYLFGVAEQIFGSGLRTGRYLAVGFAVLTVIGIWLLVRRLGGKWIGLLAVLYMLINRIGILFYVYAATQPFVACFGVWALYFALGGKQKNWQVAVGAAFAGLAAITRQNMLPFVALFILYVFWQYGRRTGLYALLSASVVFLLPHLIFWPNILSLWTLLPRTLTPFLDPWRFPYDASLAIRHIDSFDYQRDAFWEGICYYFVPFFGVLASVFLSKPRRLWKKAEDYKTYVFLVAAWFVLLAVHFYASFFMNYGIYTFSNYVAFFQYIGIAVIAVSYRAWNLKAGVYKQTGLALFLASLFTVTFFVRARWIASFIAWIPFPRIKNHQIQPGMTTLLSAIANKFKVPLDVLYRWLPVLSGILLMIVIVVLGWLLAKRLKTVSSLPLAMVAVLILGFVFTPTAFLGQGHPELTCSFDALAADETIGTAVAASIPSGSTIYWFPNMAPTPLLRLDHPVLFPPQLDDMFTFVNGGEDNLVLKFGFWNQSLVEHWMAESNYVIVIDSEQHQDIDILQEAYGQLYQFIEIPLPSVPISCQDRKIWTVHIFKVEKIQTP